MLDVQDIAVSRFYKMLNKIYTVVFFGQNGPSPRRDAYILSPDVFAIVSWELRDKKLYYYKTTDNLKEFFKPRVSAPFIK